MKLFSTVLGTILLSTGTHAQNSCPTDVKTCPDGQTLNRVPTNDCKFSLCAGEKDCTSASSGTEENYLICPNGEQMPRDGFNNCEFEECDINYRCESQDVQQCPAPYLHVYVALDPTSGAGGCQNFLPCPGSGTPENLPSSTSTTTASATPEVTSTTPEVTADDVEMTCNRNGGSAMSYEGTCDERGYTWTEQCIVEEKDGKCMTTATECGCQVFMGDGVSTSIGSGSISGCDNACVSISDDVPEGGSCQKTGESMSFDGRCDSRGYTYTSQCNFKEEVNDQNEVEQCTVSMNSCGCLWWEEDSVDTAALHSKSCTDPCAVHGYPPLPSSAPLSKLTMKAIIGMSSITLVTVAWLF